MYLWDKGFCDLFWIYWIFLKKFVLKEGGCYKDVKVVILIYVIEKFNI